MVALILQYRSLEPYQISRSFVGKAFQRFLYKVAFIDYLYHVCRNVMTLWIELALFVLTLEADIHVVYMCGRNTSVEQVLVTDC